jgi:hypothetical protein
MAGADPWVSFARVNVLVRSLLSRVAAVSNLVWFGAWEVMLADLGFPGSDQSDR